MSPTTSSQCTWIYSALVAEFAFSTEKCVSLSLKYFPWEVLNRQVFPTLQYLFPFLVCMVRWSEYRFIIAQL